MKDNCLNMQEQILELVAGTLPPEKADAIRRHIGQCPKCSQYLQALRDDDVLLGDFAEAMQPTVSRLENNVIDALNRQQSRKPVIPISIWRTIMKSRITRIAAVAVIIIAVMVVVNQFGGSIDGAGVALGKVMENMKKMPWMVMVIKGPEEVVAEQWFCFDREYWIAKTADGTITSYDYAKRAQYKYDPSSETVTIDYLSQDMPYFISSPQSILENLFEQVTDQAAKPGTEITKVAGQYEGRKVEIHKLAFSANELNHKTQLFVDIQRNLLVRMLGSSTDSDGKVIIRSEIEFEYPEKGPSNVYDLGVPKSVTVVNNIPPENVLEVLSKYEFHKANGPQRYIAIVTRGIGRVDMIYRNDELLRTESRRAVDSRRWREHRDEIEKSFDSLLDWWTSEENSKPVEVYVYDGKYDYEVHLDSDNPWSNRFTGRHPSHEALDTMGWPRLMDWYGSTPGEEANVVETDYSKDKNLICIELVRPGKVRADGSVALPYRELHYIDSKHDYIRVRQDSFTQRNIQWTGKEESWLEGIDANQIPPDELPQIREVIEVAKTEAGQWYPKRIARYADDGTPRAEKRMTILTVYLQTDPQFSDGIFEPENLPK